MWVKRLFFVSWALAVTCFGCSPDENCKQWSRQDGSENLLVSTFRACGDSEVRSVRCTRVEEHWTCSCILGDVERARFTYNSDLPKTQPEAEKLANASCAWKIDH